MKTVIKQLLELLVGIAAGGVDLVAPGVLDPATSIKHRITAAILAVVLVVLLVLFAQGCMFTTDLDGKVYSTRMDILTPIGQTVPTMMPATPIPPSTQPRN